MRERSSRKILLKQSVYGESVLKKKDEPLLDKGKSI